MHAFTFDQSNSTKEESKYSWRKDDNACYDTAGCCASILKKRPLIQTFQLSEGFFKRTIHVLVFLEKTYGTRREESGVERRRGRRSIA